VQAQLEHGQQPQLREGGALGATGVGEAGEVAFDVMIVAGGEEGGDLVVDRRLLADLGDCGRGFQRRQKIAQADDAPPLEEAAAAGHQRVKGIAQAGEAAVAAAQAQEIAELVRIGPERHDVASLGPGGGPGADRVGGDDLLEHLRAIGTVDDGRGGGGEFGQSPADAIGPQGDVAPTQGRQRVEHGDGAHYQHRICALILRAALGAAEVQRIFEAGREGRFTDAAAEPGIDGAAAHETRALFGVAGESIGKGAGVPGALQPDLEGSLAAAGRPGGDAAGPCRHRIGEKRGRWAVLRVFGEHAAGNVCDGGRQAVITDEGGEAAEFELATDDAGVVEAGARQTAEREGEQHDAERIDIVGDRSVTAAGGDAHGGIRRFVEHRLKARRRRCPGLAQDDSLPGAGTEQVVEPDGTMGEALHVQPLQRVGDGAEQAFEQLSLGPWASGRGGAVALRGAPDRGARGCGADDEPGVFSAGASGGAVGDGGEDAFDGVGEEHLQRCGAGWRVGTNLDRHQRRVAAAAVDGDEGGESAGGAGQDARGVDGIGAADQGAGWCIRRRRGRRSGGRQCHGCVQVRLPW
jgi:hypothetical protein